MIEAIRKIGIPLAELSIEEQAEALIVPVVPSEENRIVILDFDINNEQVSINILPITEDIVKEYFYIGTADGPSSPQWMLTGTKPDYIISQSIPSLLKIIEDCELKNYLELVLDKFYYDYGVQESSKERYRRILNVEKFIGLSEMEKYYKDSEKDIKKTVSNVSKELATYISKKYEVKTKNIKLWTLTINGEIIQQREEYKKLAWKLKEAHFEKAREGICSLCNSYSYVSSDTGKLKLNYYITQKVNFASEMKDFDKNLRLCKKCHKQLILGEIYTMRRLGGQIGKLRFFLIPELLFDNDNESIKVKNIQEVQDEVKSIIRFSGATEIERQSIKELKKTNYTNQYTFHFLFYMKQQQEFRVLQLIKDVSPSRIYDINVAIGECNNFGRVWFNWPDSDDRWIMTFEQIFYLFPIHQDERFVTEHRRILTLYDAILNNSKVNKKMIIEKLILLSKTYHLEQTDQYQISKPQNKETAMNYGILKGIILLRFLEKLSVITGGEKMDISQLTISEEFREFIKDVGYSEEQTSLVLLGKLIYEIGKAQAKNKLTSKPILDKINYQGMSLNKLQKLSNEVFEKLKQYKLITSDKSSYYLQNIYTDHKTLFDKNINNWNLTSQENVFYILSGYAIGSRPIEKKKDKDKEEENSEE
ncbi:CRISPR-associated protein Csh1 [Proteiniborus ethanoligenes]|uniref:CRISPR-associated protein Csh1 n=1 Tax=Proteiniborus ethanoligenes TaxID=415015 RepID=A0A1H3SMU2_9FIRM|nr:TIGR02556 family CRISPR-associated protein [Proteiniborus ethanoligenes]SDZ39244.1 CRISPR-associated protein Csh1 [Proteiniborus ethanoligenes]